PTRRCALPTACTRTVRPPPTPTLFPYTTLFRSDRGLLPVLRWRRAPARRPSGGRVHEGIHEHPPPRTTWCRGLDRTVELPADDGDRKSTRLNSSHQIISYAVFCLKKKMKRSHTT